MDLQNILKAALGDTTTNKISQATGLDSSVVSKVIAAGAPLIIGQMAKNTEDQQGAEALSSAIEKDHSGSLLDDVSSIFTGKAEDEDGIKILGHVFGSQSSSAASSLAGKVGTNKTAVVKVLSFVAPIIMSALAKQTHSNSLSSRDLASLLNSEKTPGGNSLSSLAAKFLDQDQDGSIVDDLLGIFKK